MQKKFRRLAAVMLCLTLLAVPALAAEATIDLDYVTIVGESFAACSAGTAGFMRRGFSLRLRAVLRRCNINRNMV